MSIHRSSVEKRATVARALAEAGLDDVYVLDHESAAEVLTPKRRQLLERIAAGDIHSVRSLADDIGRDKGAVSRDLEVLARHDLVAFTEEGTRKIPRNKHETVVVEPIL